MPANAHCRNQVTTSYIRYDESPVGKWVKPGLIARFLSRVLPEANPDFEHLYKSVSYWYLELDGCKPVREIGFTDAGEPIVVGPFGSNYGMWTDSPCLLAALDFPSVPAEDFQAVWDAFCRRVATESDDAQA